MSTVAYRCPGCQATLGAPVTAAGKTMECAHCGKRAIVPLPPPSRGVDLADFDFSAQAHRREPEPWYFAMASFYASLVIIVAFVAFALTSGYLVYAFVRSASYGREWLIAIWIVYFLAMIVAFLGVLFWAALVFLFVDIARSLRILKQRS